MKGVPLRYYRYGNLQIVKRYLPVVVDNSLIPKREDIFAGLKGRFNGKRTKQCLTSMNSLVKPDSRNLSDSGMHPDIVALVNKIFQNFPDIFVPGDMFFRPFSDNPTLQPLLGGFTFPFALSG